jgi:hypothetical protein
LLSLPKFNPLTLSLLTWTKWRAPASASKWWMGFNSVFKGLKAKRRPLYLKTQSVPGSKHFLSRYIKANQFMM